jgi:rhomboid family GlyGly-CTERM serine protease
MHSSASSLTDTRDRAAFWAGRRATLLVSLGMLALNVGVFPRAPEAAREVLSALEFDSAAIHQGELWRLLSGNLVHFGRNHFLLDVGVFLILGLLYEPYFRRSFPWLLLTMGLAIGLACFSFADEHTRMRGLSGVDSGLFAAALYVEFGLARKERSRWWWVGPTAILFAVKTMYETTTGEPLLGTESLLGPMKLATTAHLSGVVAAILFCAARQDAPGLKQNTES